MRHSEQINRKQNLEGPIASYVNAVNSGSQEEFSASFAADAVVVDVDRELRGLDAITAWAGADIFGSEVHYDVLDVSERQGRTIVTVRVDGTVRPDRTAQSSRDEA